MQQEEESVEVVNNLADIQAVLGVCNLGTAKIQLFITTHDITGLDTFDVMPRDEAKDIVDMYNLRNRTVAHKLGYPTQKKIQALLWWYYDKLPR